MMRWIVGSSPKLQRIVIAVAAGIVAVGIFQVSKTPVDLLPEYQPPTVEVQTEALGLSLPGVKTALNVQRGMDYLRAERAAEELEITGAAGAESDGAARGREAADGANQDR